MVELGPSVCLDGGQGRCARGNRIDENEEEVVVKLIPRELRYDNTYEFKQGRNAASSTQWDFRANQSIGAFFREVICLLLCAHPTVLPFIGWNLTPLDSQRFFHITRFVAVSPTTLSKEQFPIPPIELAEMHPTANLIHAYGVARGMAYVHSLGILHRDLQGRNILCDAVGPIIADLGWSKAVARDANTGKRGTVPYMAPEVLLDNGFYDLPADIYSYGLYLWELVTGRSWSDLYVEMTKTQKDLPLPPADDLTTNKRFLTTAGCLIRECLSSAERRPTFHDIAWRLEEDPLDYFPKADQRAFEEYRATLDQAGIEPINEHLMDLIRQLRNMLDSDQELGGFPPGTPFSENVLFCLGCMFGDGVRPNQDVMLVARYQLANRGSLDGPAFIAKLRLLENFPSFPTRFALARFLIDPTQPVSSGQILVPTIITTHDDLFHALRNILCGICCRHPCVLGFHGWNIRQRNGKWEILILTDSADPFSLEEYGKLDKKAQTHFLWTAALGMAAVHACNIIHNGLRNAASFQIKHGRAQLCNFALFDCDTETPDFSKDPEDFMRLFDNSPCVYPSLLNITDSGVTILSFEDYIREELEADQKRDEEERHHCLDLINEIQNDLIAMREPPAEDLPFDLFVRLVRSRELWTPKDGPLDVPTALSQIAWLDPGGVERFKDAVSRSIATHGFLTPDFFEEFPPFGRR
jgi:serine/threonine protein kinase